MNVVVNGQVTSTITVPEKQIVTVEKRTVQVAVVGRQGPPGGQGLPGTEVNNIDGGTFN